MTQEEIVDWIARLSRAAREEQEGRLRRRAGALAAGLSGLGRAPGQGRRPGRKGGSGSTPAGLGGGARALDGAAGPGPGPKLDLDEPRFGRAGLDAGPGLGPRPADELRPAGRGKGAPSGFGLSGPSRPASSAGASSGGMSSGRISSGSLGGARIGRAAGLLSQGYAPAVVKLVSFASGVTRASATAHYVCREDAPLETHEGKMLSDRAAVTQEMQRWAQDFERRAASQDAAGARVAVAGLSDNAEDRRRLEDVVAAVFSGHAHAARIEALRDGTLEARAVVVLAGRNEEGKAERLRVTERRIGTEDDGFTQLVFDAKSQAAMYRRAESLGVPAHALSVEPGTPAHGPDGLTQRLNQLAERGLALRSDGGSIADAASVRATAQAWKEQLRSQTPRDTMHLILSSRAGVDPEALRKAARDFLHGEFPDRKFLFALHQDRAQDGHIHVHAVVAMRDEAGFKMHPNRQTFSGWREGFAASAQAHGLKIVATGAMERASSQSYGARDKAMVDAADRPRAGREERDLAYARRPANAAMIANARRRIETARLNPIRVPTSDRQRAAVAIGQAAWKTLAVALPANSVVRDMNARLGMAAMAGEALAALEKGAAVAQREDRGVAVTAAKMTSDLQAMNRIVSAISDRLPAESRRVFVERSGHFLEIMAGRIDVQRRLEQGASTMRAQDVAKLAGVSAEELARQGHAAQGLAGDGRGGASAGVESVDAQAQSIRAASLAPDAPRAMAGPSGATQAARVRASEADQAQGAARSRQDEAADEVQDHDAARQKARPARIKPKM